MEIYDDDPIVQMSQMNESEKEAYWKVYNKGSNQILLFVIALAIIWLIGYLIH